MQSLSLHNWLIPVARRSERQVRFWFFSSLALAVVYSLPALWKAFAVESVIQDDARQHVFWMLRYLDPELFPNDLLADYFQSVAPFGYSTFYWLMAKLGVGPLLLHKLLPVLLVVVATGYCFGICLELFPVPLAGFFAAMLLNQNLWLRDDVVSATPTAFIYPLFLAFLYYSLRRSLLPCLVAIALQGLFYPQGVFVSLGILCLRLLRLQGWQPRFSRHRADYRFFLSGLGSAVLVLLPYALSSSDYGSAIAVDQARQLPEFWQGWMAFFSPSPVQFWLCGGRSGLFPTEWCELTRVSLTQFLVVPPSIVAGLSLPFLLGYVAQFPLAQQLQRIAILPQVALASLGMFVAAHTLLFKLHLPSRYTEHSLRVLVALAGGIALAVIVDAAFRWVNQLQSARPKPFILSLKILLACLLAIYSVIYPVILKQNSLTFPQTNYWSPFPNKPVYEFFSQQPKDTLIASLSKKQTSIPALSKRSVLLGGWGFAVPYHRDYYAQIEQRANDLLKAQYSPDLADVKNTIQKYGIDFWLLDRSAFSSEYLRHNDGMQQFQPALAEAIAQQEQGVVPALSKVAERCSVAESKFSVVLAAECLIQQEGDRG